MNERTISDIRQQFEDIDKSILVLLGMRQKLSIEIAAVKRLHDLPILQIEIWNAHLKRRIQENQTIKLNDDFLMQIFNLLHKESIRIQNQELRK
jgi:chorismate mutase